MTNSRQSGNFRNHPRSKEAEKQSRLFDILTSVINYIARGHFSRGCWWIETRGAHDGCVEQQPPLTGRGVCVCARAVCCPTEEVWMQKKLMWGCENINIAPFS